MAHSAITKRGVRDYRRCAHWSRGTVLHTVSAQRWTAMLASGGIAVIPNEPGRRASGGTSTPAQVSELPPSALSRLAEIDRTEYVSAAYRTVCQRLLRYHVNWHIKAWDEFQIAAYKADFTAELNAGGSYLAVEVSGRLAGVAVLGNRRLGPSNALVELRFLHVSAEHRGHGIGSRPLKLRRGLPVTRVRTACISQPRPPCLRWISTSHAVPSWRYPRMRTGWHKNPTTFISCSGGDRLPEFGVVRADGGVSIHFGARDMASVQPPADRDNSGHRSASVASPEPPRWLH